MHSLVPVALFTSTENTRSKSEFRRLAFLCKRTYSCWYKYISSSCLFICLLLHKSAPFSLSFVKGATHSLMLMNFNPNKHIITCINMSVKYIKGNFSIVYLKENMFWAFSLMYFIFLFSFYWLWNKCEDVPMLMAFSKVQHSSAGFRKRCNQ